MEGEACTQHLGMAVPHCKIARALWSSGCFEQKAKAMVNRALLTEAALESCYPAVSPPYPVAAAAAAPAPHRTAPAPVCCSAAGHLHISKHHTYYLRYHWEN